MPTCGWAGTEREKPVASGNVNWTQEYSHSHPAGGSGPWPALPGTPCWLIQEGGGWAEQACIPHLQEELDTHSCRGPLVQNH